MNYVCFLLVITIIMDYEYYKKKEKIRITIFYIFQLL
jgi:hypothetical protein